jgi:hypothetical protein
LKDCEVFSQSDVGRYSLNIRVKTENQNFFWKISNF